MKFPAKNALLATATSALVIAVMQASPAAAGGKVTCPCINATTINKLYGTLGFSPEQDGIGGNVLACTNDPTIKTLDLSETVTVLVPSVTPNELVASVADMSNPVTDEPFTFKERNLLIDVMSQNGEVKGYCRVDAVINAGDVIRDAVPQTPLDEDEVAACMSELQASKAWAQVCNGG